MEEVSVVKCTSYNNEKVKNALLDSFRNINFNFKKNLKVLIKPNVLGQFKPEQGITTHPVIIGELCKILKKYNAEIYIGDSSGEDTNKALEVSGIKALSKYAKIINFEGQDKQFFSIYNITVPLPKIIHDVDLIINIAKLKTHVFTKVSLCAKNLYGCVPGRLKSNFHRKFPSEKDLSNFIFELHEKIKPQLNIIDGISGIEGEGPGTSGIIKKSNLIITSRNAFAADIIASEIMGFDYEDIITNKLSNLKIQDILVIGEKNIKLNFQKPKIYQISFLSHFTKYLPKSKISFNKNNCTKCHLCEKKCPVNAIYLPDYPICNHKKCIRCLCCIEICPSNAIYLKEPVLINKIKNFIKKLFNL